ncbi:PREDICTED: protein CROWDED NUCLEI 3-like [Lupinus angustifolius]|uniref:protein CROWDED NUCLEI 3-like n=1 Tax=Lupinus angustifolius TaxID=3871 RepID=UPI00092FAF42|nr:PREDICTED: protein CROWDED NUCLEI 3-like [Lupinus angustifolius]
MDFHTLSRKQLQSLCKKNKIPANITNLAMADALTSLPHVEGLDEFLNPTEVNGGAPDIRHTVSQMKRESTNVNSRVRRGSRAKNVEAEHDNVIVLPDTPVPVPPTCNRRRKALPVSNHRKKEVDVVIVDDDDDDDGVQLKDVAKTPAAISRSRSRATGQTVPVGTTYNTRRSMRLLEKNMSNMTLTDTQDMACNNLKQEMDSVSDQTHDSAETEEVNDAGKTGELEVSSLENYTELEEVQLVSGTDNDVGIGLQADAKEDASGSEDSSELEIGTIQDALSVEAAKDANMPFAEQDDDALSVEVSNEADQYAAGSIPMSSESNDSVNLKELVECNTDTDNQGGNEYDDNKDKNNETSDGKYLQSFEHIFDADEKAADEKDLAILEEVLEHLEEDLEAKPEYLEESMADVDKIDDFSGVTGAALAALEVSTESSADKCSMDAENVFFESSLVDVAVHEAEYLMDNREKLEAEAAFDIPVASYATLDSEMDTTSENPMMVMDFCSESLGADKMDAENFTLGSSLVDVVVHEAEDLKVNAANIEVKAQLQDSEEHTFDDCGASSAILAAEMDATFKNSTADIEFCSDSYGDTRSIIDAEKATLESSLLNAGIPEARELKDDYEKLDFKAQAVESEKYSLAEELKDNLEKLDLKAQAEESEEHALAKESEEHALAHESEENPEAEKLRDNSEKVDFKAAAEESEEHAEAEKLRDNSERLDFQAQAEVSEEIATTKQESSVLAETVSVGPTKEQKISDIQIQSVMADQLKGETLFPPRSETNEFTNAEENMPNANMMKENLSTAELDKKSVRELKKMLKNLTLNGKPNCKSKTINVVNEVEKKRTALQTLSENLMTNTEKHRMMDE